MNDDSLTDSAFLDEPEINLYAGLKVSEELHISGKGRSKVLKGTLRGRTVIIKCLKPEYAAEPVYRALLRKEYDIGVSLSHPNIAKVLSFKELPGLGPSIIEEYVAGQTLKHYVEGKGKLTKNERFKILKDICRAVDYIHMQGMVHRDLKPSNIMVTEGRDAKVIDFGAADGAAWDMLKISQGTPKYAAPEQFDKGASATPANDIYALGKITKELLGNNLAAKLTVRKCCSTSPGKRFKKASDIVRRINRLKNLERIFSFIAISAVLLTFIYIIRPKVDAPVQMEVPAMESKLNEIDIPGTNAPEKTEMPIIRETSAENSDGREERIIAVDGDDITPIIIAESAETPDKEEIINEEGKTDKKESNGQTMAPPKTSAEIERLYEMLRAKTWEYANEEVSNHITLCDTATSPGTYRRLWMRHWRNDALMAALKWFEPYYKENKTELPNWTIIHNIIAGYIDEIELSRKDEISAAEEKAYKATGSEGVFRRPLPIPTPDGNR